jgi:hypothetical protein
MELRYSWESEIEWLWVVLMAFAATVFPLALLGGVVERSPGAVQPVLVVLLFLVPFGALAVWVQRTGRWRRHARLLGGPDGLTLVDGDGRQVSIPAERLEVQRLVVRIITNDVGVVTHERRYSVVEDSSTGDGWALEELAWSIDERFWRESGVEPRAGRTLEGGRKDLMACFPSVRRFGTVDAGYSALAWLILTMTWSGVIGGLATVLGAHFS